MGLPSWAIYFKSNTTNSTYKRLVLSIDSSLLLRVISHSFILSRIFNPNSNYSPKRSSLFLFRTSIAPSVYLSLVELWYLDWYRIYHPKTTDYHYIGQTCGKEYSGTVFYPPAFPPICYYTPQSTEMNNETFIHLFCPPGGLFDCCFRMTFFRSSLGAIVRKWKRKRMREMQDRKTFLVSSSSSEPSLTSYISYERFPWPYDLDSSTNTNFSFLLFFFFAYSSSGGNLECKDF